MSMKGWGVLLIVGCLVAGCGKDAPALKTYAVKGQVVYQEDGRPMTAGSVEFESTTDAGRGCRGDLDAEGRFTLSTLAAGNKKQAGAAEGKYRVTVLPAQDSKQMAQPIALPGTYEVRPNDDNDFVLKVPGKRR
jgi:hypothetical protein